MNPASGPIALAHHFLIAMPGLDDDIFGRSVVYVCEHSDRGALGLVINKSADLDLQTLFHRIDLPLHRGELQHMAVLRGGPVQTDRGFVLHDSPGAAADAASYPATMGLPDGLAMTTSRDVLQALAEGKGPARVMVALGYSAWAGGQLESEIAENSWLTVRAQATLLFETPLENRYDEALRLLGVSATALSTVAGHA